MNYPDWYISRINQFSELGFFNNVSVSKVADRIIQDSSDHYFGPILKAEDDKLIDQIITSFDQEKCWFVEDWMIAGSEFQDVSEFYLDVLFKFNRISESKFNPRNIGISKCGHTDLGQERLKIELDLNNKHLELVFAYDSEALILTFLQELNEHTSGTGYTFECIRDNYGPCFIYCLAKDQLKVLKGKFRWEFYVGNNYWLDKANYMKEVGSYDQAISSFQKSISANQSPSCYYDFGSFLIEQNNADRAVEIFQEGIKFLKNQPEDFTKKEWWIEMLESKLESINN